MTPNVVFHIGAPKTGSTYLQKRLRNNTDVLARHHLHYPVVAGFEKVKANAKRLTIAFDADLAGNFSINFPDLDLSSLDPREELDALVKSPPADTKTIILSSEKMRNWQAKPLADLIGSDFPCRIVLYVRKQDDWLDSYFNQLVKNRECQSIDDAVDKAVSGHDRTFFCPDWLLNYNEWSENFEDLKVVPYDAPAGDIFEKFVRAMDFPRSDVFHDIEKTNESLSTFEITYLARVGTDVGLPQFLKRRKACKEIARIVARTGGKASFLSKQHRQALRDRFQAGNSELLARLGLDDDLLAIKPEAENFVSISDIAASDGFKDFESAVKRVMNRPKQ